MSKVADPVRKDDRHYVYRDYASWLEEERWELIDGVAYSMSPAPSADHQRLVGDVYYGLRAWLAERGGPSEAFISPLDVLLPGDPSEPDDDVDTVVQPDVIVVCDPAKIVRRGCRGAPDLVVEVLSPWTSHKDQLVKHDLYARHGVREFWVVDPGNRCVRVYRLEAGTSPGRFGEPTVLFDDRRVESTVLEGYGFPVSELFARLR